MPYTAPYLVIAALPWLASSVAAQDWPMYRADSSRTAYTRHELPKKLEAQWHYQPSRGPAKAWPRQKRLQYDSAFQPVVGGGRMFFGSSSDGRLRALDAQFGGELWKLCNRGSHPVCASV